MTTKYPRQSSGMPFMRSKNASRNSDLSGNNIQPKQYTIAERSMNMYRITIFGKPYLRPMEREAAERLVAKLAPVIQGVGMTRVSYREAV